MRVLASVAFLSVVAAVGAAAQSVKPHERTGRAIVAATQSKVLVATRYSAQVQTAARLRPSLPIRDLGERKPTSTPVPKKD